MDIRPRALELPIRPARRQMLAGLVATGAGAVMGLPGMSTAQAAVAAVTTAAARLAADGFRGLPGRRVGLITNQTGRVGDAHLVDLMVASAAMKLTAIFAPEHGFRGVAEAGEKVEDGRDARTGVPILSLYGATKAPTPEMLREVDVLVFDIQDIGARFYTYISTMGLAMQAAARRAIPFVVLDRPNPIGGDYVSGFVLEPGLKSFVGQYPIPIVHGMTVGELARMIVAERWLDGLANLALTVMPCRGLTRAMRWPATGLAWVPTSPNIPSFQSALLYPGIGVVGETLVNEGRGTPAPFTQFGAPWLDARRLSADLNRLTLPGLRCEAVTYTPRSIPNVAANPRFLGRQVNAVRIAVADADAVRPLELGMHALALLQRQAAQAGVPLLPDGTMFSAIAGTPRLRAMVERGAAGADIIAAWQVEVAAFSARRKPHLMY
jgi:uncharacterized protein YbbC (DUF1343 family)